MLDSAFNFPAVLWGIVLLAVLFAAAFAGHALHRRVAGRAGQDAEYEVQEGYTISSVVTLLIFLIGFVFAIALDRYEARRQLVVDDALAIEKFYLQAQLLDEPYRSDISRLLVRYTDNRLVLAQGKPSEMSAAIAENNQLTKELWVATIAAFQTIRGIDFSSAFVDTANNVIELNSARIAARSARIPASVFLLLTVYAVATALMFGYVLHGRRGRISGVALLVLCTLAIVMLVDLNQPVTGWIRESQQPVQRLSGWMHANPSASFGEPAIPDPVKK